MAVDYLPLALLCGLWAAGLSALVSTLRSPEQRWEASGQSKGLALVGIVVTCGIGGLSYCSASVPTCSAPPSWRTVPHPADRPDPPPGTTASALADRGPPRRRPLP